MKQIKKWSPSKTAIFAGAAALMALTPGVHAQTSVDNLLNKLEQKGILTPSEADELKTENATNSVADFNQQMNSRFPVPDWITSYKLYGDFRGRLDERATPNPAQPDNLRVRYRLRVALQINMKDNLQAGFRLISDDSSSTGLGGNPLSGNTTLQGNATKKFIYVDEAYGKWMPITNDDWMVTTTIGKMEQPFQETPMVYDVDYTPEGGALQSTYKLDDWNSLAFNTAAFVLAYSGSAAQNMSFLYGGQLLWTANWTGRFSTTVGGAGYEIVNTDLLTPGQTGTGNTGNSVNAAGAPVYGFNPIVGEVNATYKLDSFPLYRGAFPIKFIGEYMYNPSAPGPGGPVVGQAPSGNVGYYAGVIFGQAAKRGMWDIGYRYESLDANAWFSQIVNDDDIVYNTALVGPPARAAGFAGGTNIKGHLVTADYALTDALLFSLTCYISSQIGNTNPGPGNTTSQAIHAMVDLMWRF
jgi:hypothetical protein